MRTLKMLKTILYNFGRWSFFHYQNIRQKIEWNVEFILPGSPTTNVMHVYCGKEGRRKERKQNINKKIKITCTCSA